MGDVYAADEVNPSGAVLGVYFREETLRKQAIALAQDAVVDVTCAYESHVFDAVFKRCFWSLSE